MLKMLQARGLLSDETTESRSPFSYAVVEAFEGEADGYRRGETTTDPDGETTIQELVECVVDVTKKHTSLQDSDNDPDPQVRDLQRIECSITTLTPTYFDVDVEIDFDSIRPKSHFDVNGDLDLDRLLFDVPIILVSIATTLSSSRMPLL